jgi:phosphoserine phosphatase RsbU/P
LNGRRFTTAFLAELNPATGTLTYLSAGHNPPILVRENGEMERLESECIPLGIELTERYAASTTVMRPHEMLVIYTDGITEARNLRSESFGEAQLLAAIQPGETEERASVRLGTIMKKLDEFTGSAEQHDDITCLVVRRI